jgi:hypothetical protein
MPTGVRAENACIDPAGGGRQLQVSVPLGFLIPPVSMALSQSNVEIHRSRRIEFRNSSATLSSGVVAERYTVPRSDHWAASMLNILLCF